MTASFYPPYHLGGDATHVKYLAEALVKEGHEVHVLASLDAYRLKNGTINKKEEHNGVKVHWLKAPSGKKEIILNYTFGTQKYTLDFFKNLVKTEKFDVVHHHNISLLGYNILKKQGKYRNLYTAHDYWLICPKYDLFRFGKICSGPALSKCIACCIGHKKPYQPFRRKNAFRDAISDIDVIIAPSKYMQKTLKSNGIKNKIVQIYNFVPEPPKRLKNVPYSDYYLFVGVLDTHKGIIPLLDTFKRIPNKKLIIIGKGRLQKQVETVARHHKNIFYLGFKPREETLAYMKHANALILPSIWAENNPLTIIEGLSIGTPTIGSNAGGIPEIIRMTDDRLLFTKETEIIKLLSVYPKRNNLIKQFKQHFLIQIYLKNYYSLIKYENT